MQEARRTFNIPDFEGSIDILVGDLKAQGWDVRGPLRPLYWEIWAKTKHESDTISGEVDHLEATSYNPRLTKYLASVDIKPLQ